MQGPARAGRDLDLSTALVWVWVWVWAVAGLAMHERRSGCLAGFDAATSFLIGLHAEFVCEGTRLCRFAGHSTRRCLRARWKRLCGGMCDAFALLPVLFTPEVFVCGCI